MRGAFTDELPLKVVALLLAVTLFVVVRSDRDAATGATVKVVYTLPSDRVLVSEPASVVHLNVRGPWTRLQRFDDRDLPPVQIDLTRSAGGDIRLTEDMIKVPAGLRVTSISPADVKIEFERRVEREVSVTPQVAGEPAEGFRLARVSAQPRRVLVDGARSAVEALATVATRPLRIAGARSTVRGDVDLDVTPRYVHVVGTPTIQVVAEITAAMAERTLDSLPIRAFGVSRGEALLEPHTATVVLRGAGEVLSDVALGRVTLAVDGTSEDGRSGTYTKRVVVSGLPAGVAAEVRPDTVRMTIGPRRRREAAQ